MTKIDSFGNRKKRNASVFDSDNLTSLPADLHEERWINIVYEYIQKAKLGPPAFEERGVHPSTGPFTCTLRLPNGPLIPFGSDLGTFKKKSDAKLAAAQQATKWLRSQGLVAQSTAKRRRSSTEAQLASDSIPVALGETGLTQALTRQLGMDHTAEQGTLPERCTKLIVELGFSQPTFEFEPLEGAFYNVHATFNSRDENVEPRLSGKIGRVEAVYGKKQAKEQCWREISKVLEAIRVDRMAMMSHMAL
ncbi:uncharacterized protein MYCFIDRAFT_211345 [Pseudocercospora fijiensis CIRAD86]|uniref:DRBM domain-containing protein n=1 Tax=Pseudocercospora fijiensis (strain CIRAD86) TaxID=383855 RepID=M3B212_PSEFD|nr:uncharacterized protein MYCFIDRAFT_211345 [Pseudocercospora fijiensis CIRAD86]EME83452.1 hypothetical protein MYCFIDRAFT_211345 [Pseudocercospora fijiensis CIRAD86]